MAVIQPLKIVTGITQQMSTADEPQFGGLGVGVAPTTNLLSVKSHSAYLGSQFITLTAAVSTSNATQTTLATVAIDTSTTGWFDVKVVARITGTPGENAVYWRFVKCYRDGVAAPTLGTIRTPVADDETGGLTNADVTFTVSGNNILVSVTGVAATAILWVGTLTYQVISGAA